MLVVSQNGVSGGDREDRRPTAAGCSRPREILHDKAGSACMARAASAFVPAVRGCDDGREIVDDPLRMYLVIPRGAVTSLARAGELAGAAAVPCARSRTTNCFAADFAAWCLRPGKVTLRARRGQWSQLLAEEAHVLAGDWNGEAV